MSYTKTDPTEAIGPPCQDTTVKRYRWHCDNYGNKPDKPLKWVNQKMSRRLNEATPYLANLL
ncbi:MAG: hypothetical protein ACKPKO_45275, partial [Candidatus Fonsibacter sp.]